MEQDHPTDLSDLKTLPSRRYSISEFVEEKAPTYVRLHDTSHEEACRSLRQSITAFLRWLPKGKEGRFPGTSGYVIRKITDETFELTEE